MDARPCLFHLEPPKCLLGWQKESQPLARHLERPVLTATGWLAIFNSRLPFNIPLGQKNHEA
jgi:hypothetical protein